MSTLSELQDRDGKKMLSRPHVIQGIITYARGRDSSDVHIVPGQQVSIRVNGNLEHDRLYSATPDDIQDFFDQVFSQQDIARLRKIGVHTAGFRSEATGPIRVHAYRERRGFALEIRLLAREIPTIESLHLPEALKRFTRLASGLVLIVGPTGSGKTSALAALVNEINSHSAKHVRIFEDPIEFEHASKRSLITQVAVGPGQHIGDFTTAVQKSLQSDPDVLVVGEARENETIQAIVTAADSGHLVFATLHTAETTAVIDKIIGSFAAAEQPLIRNRLAASLVAVIGLRLVASRTRESARLPATELLIVDSQISTCIRTNESHRIAQLMGVNQENHTLEQDLQRLVDSSLVYAEDARAAARYPDALRRV